ncbi:hypothetical protein D3C76_1054990 [compost metagenome]
MRLEIHPLDIRLGLIVKVPVEQHAALADRVDRQAVGRVGEVDQAPGRWAVGHRPRCRADLGRQVVRHFMGAGGCERADVEDPVQRLLLPQRVAMGQRVRLAPLPLRGIGTQGGLEVGDAGKPRDLDGVGAGFLAEGITVVPPR